MSDGHSDALVFFGATGDLAYRKIFPALALAIWPTSLAQAMCIVFHVFKHDRSSPA